MKALLGLLLVVATCRGAVYQRSNRPIEVEETVLDVEPVDHVEKILEKVLQEQKTNRIPEEYVVDKDPVYIYKKRPYSQKVAGERDSQDQNKLYMDLQNFGKIKIKDEVLPARYKDIPQKVEDTPEQTCDIAGNRIQEQQHSEQTSPEADRPMKQLQKIYHELQTPESKTKLPYEWIRIEVGPRVEDSGTDRRLQTKQNPYDHYTVGRRQQQKRSSQDESGMEMGDFQSKRVDQLQQNRYENQQPFEYETPKRQYAFTQPRKRYEANVEQSSKIYQTRRQDVLPLSRDEEIRIFKQIHDVEKMDEKKVQEKLDMLKKKFENVEQKWKNELDQRIMGENEAQISQIKDQHSTIMDRLPSDFRKMMDQLNSVSKYRSENAQDAQEMKRIFHVASGKDMSHLFPAGEAILSMMLEQYRWYQPLELKNIKDFTGFNKTYLRNIVEELPEVMKTVNEPATLTVLYTKAVVEEVMNQRLKCPSTVLVKILMRQAKKSLVSLMQRFQMVSYNFLKRSLSEILDENEAEKLAKVGVEEANAEVFYNVMHYIASHHVGDVERLSQKLFTNLFEFFVKRQESTTHDSSAGQQQTNQTGDEKSKVENDKRPEDQDQKEQGKKPDSQQERRVQKGREQTNELQKQVEQKQQKVEQNKVGQQQFDELIKIIEEAITQCNVKCPVGSDLETVNQFVLWDLTHQFVPKSAMVLASRLEQMFFRRIFYTFAARGQHFPMEIYRYITERMHPALFDVVQLYYNTAVRVVKDYERMEIPREAYSYLRFIQRDIGPEEKPVVEKVLKTLGWKFNPLKY